MAINQNTNNISIHRKSRRLGIKGRHPCTGMFVSVKTVCSTAVPGVGVVPETCGRGVPDPSDAELAVDDQGVRAGGAARLPPHRY